MEQLSVGEIEIQVESYIDNNPHIKEGFNELQDAERKSFKDGLGLLFKMRYGAVSMVDQDSKVLTGVDGADQTFKELIVDHIETYNKYDLNQDGGPNWLDTTATELFKLVQGQNQSDYSGQRDRVFSEAYLLRRSLHDSGTLYENVVISEPEIQEKTKDYLYTTRPDNLRQIDGYYREFDSVLKNVRHPSNRVKAED